MAEHAGMTALPARMATHFTVSLPFCHVKCRWIRCLASSGNAKEQVASTARSPL